MKILIDMNLSPSWRGMFASYGHEAKHWSEIGLPDAADPVLMEWALQNGYVVLTHDLDYGKLLYLTGATGPSVIQLRSDNVSPENVGAIVLQVLRDVSSEIDAGAIVTIQSDRHRLSVLPLKPERLP